MISGQCLLELDNVIVPAEEQRGVVAGIELVLADNSAYAIHADARLVCTMHPQAI